MALALLTGAAVVGVWLYRAGWGIPCIFYQTTGWKCPGCGVTRMLSALAAGEWQRAAHENVGILVIMPALVFLATDSAVTYVKTGFLTLTLRVSYAVSWGCVAWLLLFAVWRNVVSVPH